MNELQARPLDTSKYCWTLRLTFHYEGEHLALAKQQRVRMVAPGSPTALPVADQNSGFWVEVRDGRDHVLFHRVLQNPMSDFVEVHSPEGKIQVVPVTRAQGEFEVLVPDIPEAAGVVVFGSPRDLKRTLAPAQEIGRFPLEVGAGAGRRR